MAIEFYLDPVNAEYERPLPGVSQKPKRALWLRSQSGNFEEADLECLLEAFAPLRGLGWYAVMGLGDQSAAPAMDPFEDWPDLVNEPVCEGVLRFPQVRQAVFSRVAWLSGDAHKALPDFLRYRPGHPPGTISFMPRNLFAAINWARIVQGPAWLSMCDKWIANAPLPSLDSWAVAASYVNLTIEMNGVAGLTWVDCDVKTGLTFFGSEEHLGIVAAQLDGLGNFIEDEEFVRRLFRRGFYFSMSR